MGFPHRLLVPSAVAALLACGGRPVTPTVPLGATPDATVEAFLDAVRSSNLAAMAGLWGDERGPSNVTNRIPAAERERRLVIIQRVLRHEERRIAGTDAQLPAQPVVRVELVQGGRRFTVPFTLVQVRRGGGWVVREIGLDAAMPAARPRPGTPGTTSQPD